MRSRRTAVDDGTWLYHVIFEQDPANPDPRPVDYIVISSGGDGDDDFGSAAGVAPDYMTLWGSGIISFGQVTKAQIVFMGLANPNLDTSLFPGVFSDLGYLDPATVETINVEIKYELVTAFPTVLTRVVYTSDGFSELASYQNRLGSETINASGNVRPALNFQIFGEETDDVLVGSGAAQTIYGFGGHDTLTTGAAQTDLFGGEGDDTLTDRFGQANVYGEAGADVIQAGPGDFIDGGADNDTILAVTQSAADLIANGFTGIRGYFDGGTGIDKAVFDLSAATAAITLTLEDWFDFSLGDYVTLGETLALVRMEETEIRGGAGADVITGAGLADTILGGAGADVLSGGGGRDTLDGGTGGLGAGQFDRLEGGADDDTYIVRTGTEQLVEEPGDGTDTVRTDIAFVLADQFENLTLTGTGAIGGTGNGLANTLLGNTGVNTLDGRGGHDVLNGGKGADTMLGGSGDDLFIVDNTADKVVELFGEGDDTVQSAVSFALAGTFVETLRLTGSGNINATGNAQGNVLFGNSGANVLTGLGGNDALSGGSGADTMIGGTGDDSYSVDNTADKVTELDGEGSDAVRSTVTFSLAGGFAEILRLLGSAAIDGTGNDLANTLYGNTGANVLTGLGGNDVIHGDQGADTMAGGFGDDLFIVDNAADKVIELSGQGTDTIQSFVSYGLGGTFVETLRLMGVAAINAVGNSQANALYGNGAANVIDGQGGADRMLGGAGDDTYVVDNAADRVVERSGEGTDRILAGVSFTLAETYVETLQLTGAGAIDAAGNSQANTLLGNGAANMLTGLGGSDVLDGGGGADRMVGGIGDDVYQVDNTLDVVVEAAGEGTDTVFASATFSLVGSDVEVLRLAGLAAINATGNDLANTLVGNDAANILTGLGGHDMLDGGKGADTMIGGDGDDTFFVDNSADRTTEVSGGGTDIVYSSASFNLAGVSVETLALTGSAAINGTGNSAANTLIGNAEANTLSGLGSADTLDGGLGADKLIGGTGGDVFRFSAFASDADADTITDFLSGTDQIALVSAAFNEMRLGPLAVSAFVAGTAALDAADRLVYEAASGKLWFDSDGTGEDAAVLIALLAPGTALAAADIVIV